VRSVLALGLALALALLAAPAAQGQEAPEPGVDVTVLQPWPEQLDRGWVPILVDLENGAARERDVRIVARSPWGAIVRVETSVRLAPLEKTRVELTAPVVPPYPAACFVEIGVDGERLRATPSSASMSWGGTPTRNLLFVSATKPAAGDLERWASEISAAGAGPGRPTPHPFAVTLVAATNLPSRFESYSSIAAVVLDARDEWPRAEALDALGAATRLGGSLAILGPEASAKARRVPALAAWIEERFESTPAGAAARTYRMGFGTLVVGDDAALLDDPDQRAALHDAAERVGAAKLGFERDSSGLGTAPTVGFEGVPPRALAALLLVCAFSIGLGSFFVVKKTGRPGILLVVVPALGLVFSGGLLAYGAIAQGLDVKVDARTVTILDERSHRATSTERRVFFAGLSPGPGLRCGAGTALFAEPHSDFGRRPQFTVDLREGTLLAGGFMPVREPVRQVIASDRAARARIETARDGDAMVVRNFLGAGVLSIVLRDASGQWFGSPAFLAEGESARLDSLGTPGSVGPGVVIGGEFDADLPPGSYAAWLDAAAFRDSLGIEVHDVATRGATDKRHLLLGILESEGPR